MCHIYNILMLVFIGSSSRLRSSVLNCSNSRVWKVSLRPSGMRSRFTGKRASTVKNSARLFFSIMTVTRFALVAQSFLQLYNRRVDVQIERKSWSRYACTLIGHNNRHTRMMSCQVDSWVTRSVCTIIPLLFKENCNWALLRRMGKLSTAAAALTKKCWHILHTILLFQCQSSRPPSVPFNMSAKVLGNPPKCLSVQFKLQPQ